MRREGKCLGGGGGGGEHTCVTFCFCYDTDSTLKFDWLKALCSHVGLGRMKSRDDEWIEHQDAFDQILADLNAKQGMFILHYLQIHLDSVKGV